MVGIEQLSWLHLLICYLIHTIEHSLDFRYIFMLETLALIGSLKIFFSDVSAKMFLNNLVWKAMWELFCCMHRFFVALLVYFFPILILLSQNQVLALIFFSLLIFYFLLGLLYRSYLSYPYEMVTWISFALLFSYALSVMRDVTHKL